MTNNTSPKTLIIGLDGASPYPIYRLAERDIMPTVRVLMQEGLAQKLRSTIPPVTCPAWVSSYTGVNIGKHGIPDFFLSIDLRRKKITFADSTKRKVKAFWKLRPQ